MINPIHERILDKIVELKKKAGINCLYDWRSWGLNPYRKCGEGIVLEVDYGTPGHLLTPEGYYVFGSILYSGNAMNQFWRLFYEEFRVRELRPKRDDSKIGELEYQLCPSGPYLLIEGI